MVMMVKIFGKPVVEWRLMKLEEHIIYRRWFPEEGDKVVIKGSSVLRYSTNG